MEKTLTNKIINKLNKDTDTWVRKRLSSGMSGTTGWPDITGVKKLNLNSLEIGVRIEIEVKQPGKKPTTIQYSRLRRFRKLGAICFWTDDLDNCMKQFKYWCDNVGVDFYVKDLMPRGPATILPDL